MKVALVYFTFDKDEELINYTAQARNFFENKKDEIDVYIINDANHPIRKIPANCILKSTSCNRGSHMNSATLFVSMYKILKEIIDTKDYDWVIKIDSDTWIKHIEWIRNINPAEVGEVGYLKYDSWDNLKCNYCNGPCVALSPLAINLIVNYISDKSKFLRLQLYYNAYFTEDIVKSYIIQEVGLKQLNVGNFDLPAVKRGNYAISFKDFIHPLTENYTKVCDIARSHACKLLDNYIKALPEKIETPSFTKPPKVGIFFIGTGLYSIFLANFYKSFKKNFLNDCKLHFYVYTDDKSIKSSDDITVIYTEAKPWPYPTLYRFKYFADSYEFWENNDYVFFFNSNCLVVKNVCKEEWLVSNKPLYAMIHPKTTTFIPRCIESNQKSTAYFDDLCYYVMGGIQRRKN